MDLFDTKPKPILSEAAKYSTDFQTPVDVCLYMASMVPPLSEKILEPTPGIGNLVEAIKLEYQKRNDINYEITAPADFFTLKESRFDCIVMNPPFSSKYAFMENAPEGFDKLGMRLGYYILTECMKMSNNIIALMPWFTISDSDVRLRYLKDYGLKSVTALPRKTFQYARVQTVVLELEKEFKQETIFKVYDRI